MTALGAEAFVEAIDSVLDEWRMKDREQRAYWFEDYTRRLAALGVPAEMAVRWLRAKLVLRAKVAPAAQPRAQFPRGAMRP